MTLEPNIETKSGLNKTEGAHVESVPATPESGVPVESGAGNQANPETSTDQLPNPGESVVSADIKEQVIQPIAEQSAMDSKFDPEAAGKLLADIVNGGDLAEHGGEEGIVAMLMGESKGDKN
jgi:hypothetical protein